METSPKYNFSAVATKAGVRCSDGVIIGKHAFNCSPNGTRVPLVWAHNHDTPDAVVGHAMLFDRGGDVHAECYLNNTPNGQLAKELVEHQDIFAVSIWANGLTKRGDLVTHGEIKELSLVLAGANPEAKISEVIQHDDGDKSEMSGYFCFNEPLLTYLEHGDNIDKEDDTMDPTEMTLDEAIEQLDHLSDDDKMALGTIINAVRGLDEDDEDDADEADDHNNKEDTTMKHSVFDDTTNQGILAHDAIKQKQNEGLKYILQTAFRHKDSMRETYLAHADELSSTYGIDNIEYLFNDPKDLTNTPAFIKRDTNWVASFMASAKHQPFSKIRTRFANITEDQARAKGYLKGKLKKEEVFSLLKRVTDATTVYKKQKLDRDDVIEITDFDVVSWLKAEMRLMLDEELARAALLGDGRLTSDDDHIDESRIRPIATDSDLFTVKVLVDVPRGATEDVKAQKFIDSVIRARRHYKGSGNPVLYTTEEMLTECLLLKDGVGHDLYETVEQLAKKLRVSKIETVEVMETATGANGKPLIGVLVNPIDYTFGADKGGSVNMFDDFDINYNQMIYLMETRCSGALTVPYSAEAFELNEAQS